MSGLITIRQTRENTLELVKKVIRVCSHGCGAKFTCEETCGNPERACWCKECLFKAIEEGIRTNQPFRIVSVSDRIKCSLLTKEEKEKLMLCYVTNKVENEEE